MKKILIILLPVFICVLSVATSCKKYYSTTDTQVLQALTDTFFIDSTQWHLDTNGYYYYTKSNIANLRSNDTNTNIIDSGAVLIYLSLDTGRTYELLPSNYNNGHDYIGRAGDGEVTIFAYPSPDTTVPKDFVSIKVVSIPSIISPEIINFDPHDYEETKKAFHLRE